MSTNEDGNSSLSCYDSNGQVTESVPPTGVATNSLTPSSCAASNIYPSGYLNSSGQENLPVALASDATLITYNPTGQKTTVSAPAPVGQTTRSLTTYTYDLAGNLIETQSPSPSNVSGSAPSITTYTYDAANELISETTAQGTPASSTTSNCYDPNGDITATVPGDGNIGGLSSCESSFPWSALSSSGTSSTYATSYQYNPVGELVKQLRPATNSNPNGTLTTYSYDQVGNMVSSTSPTGVITTNSYTSQDQLASTTYSDSTPSVTYQYDPSGQIIQMKDGTGTSTYSYDPFGDIISATNGQGQTINYTYDSSGNETSISYSLPTTADTWATSPIISYGYDNTGNISDVSDFTGKATTTNYNKDGLPIITSFGQSQANSGSSATNSSPFSSSPSITNTYDSSDEISSITASNNSGMILGFSYLQSPSGSIASQTNAGASSSSSGSSSTYSYDPLSRVTQMTASTGSSTGTSSTYTYDPSSNLTILPNGASGTCDPAGELTSSILPSTASSPQRSTTYTYNANGERTSSAASTSGSSTPQVSTSTTWNAANELTSYTSPSATYDGQGLRTSASFSSASSGTTTEHYLYNQSTSLPELLTDSTNAYIYNSSIAPFEQINLNTEKTTYLITDATESVRAVMSVDGEIEATTNYDAYGNPTTNEGLSSYTPFGFSGSYTDTTGLIYLINRYYDPLKGQFISVDPLVAQTGQPYSYTGGDPVNLTDPSGMCPYGLEVCPGLPQYQYSGNALASGGIPFTCQRPYTASGQAFGTTTASYIVQSIDCSSGPLLSGTLSAGSTAAQARAAAEASGYDIPPNYEAEPARNGAGWVFRIPGSSGDANIIRVGEVDTRNPTGYVRYYNSRGQPLNSEGYPGANSETHLPLDPDDPVSEEEPGDGFGFEIELSYNMNSCSEFASGSPDLAA
ncbi:MAG: RHS repeat-associated core domain-containing protein [Firmicutes bacterium]|nr:RHS repeat-associated core domain-containing protein [Bacillota bacterium]